MRRRGARVLGAAVAALGAAAVALPASAGPGAFGYDVPQGPAPNHFADDFPTLIDHQWEFELGGFGGIEKGAPLTRTPVIFVHGNNRDAGDWYLVRDDFLAAGWTMQELWALSYNGLGNNYSTGETRTHPDENNERRDAGWDGSTKVTDNEINVPDLYDFIVAVREYTGSERFSIVGHSLGVTLARRTLKVHPELREDLVAFVGIAGANHGTSLCPPGSEGVLTSCDEIAAGTQWLADLNGPDGEDETYAPARWMTVYDGTGGLDSAFLGPAYASSPELKGADNRTFAATHDGLRTDPGPVEAYRLFLEEADAAQPVVGPAPEPAPEPGPAPEAAPSSDELPATGGGLALAGPVMLVGALALRRSRVSRPPTR